MALAPVFLRTTDQLESEIIQSLVGKPTVERAIEMVVVAWDDSRHSAL